jgi:hypothetical protein
MKRYLDFVECSLKGGPVVRPPFVVRLDFLPGYPICTRRCSDSEPVLRRRAGVTVPFPKR